MIPACNCSLLHYLICLLFAFNDMLTVYDQIYLKYSIVCNIAAAYFCTS